MTAGVAGSAALEQLWEDWLGAERPSRALRVRQGDVALEVASDDPRVLTELAGYLVAAYDVDRGHGELRAAAPRVRCVIGSTPPPLPQRKAETVRILEASSAFPQELGRRWRVGDASWVTANDATGTVVYLNRSSSRGAIVAPDSETAFRAAYRLVREYFSRSQQARGYVGMHAAVCSYGDSLFAFVGEKAAGKTTLLLAALDLLGCGYVGSDRILVNVLAGGRVTVLGQSESLNVGVGTLARYERFRRFVPADLAGVAASALWDSDRKVALSPAQVLDMTAGTPRTSVLRGVLFPALDRTASFSVDELDRESVERELRRHLRVDAPDAPYWRHYVPLSDGAVERRRRQLSAAIAASESVSFHRVVYGAHLRRDELRSVFDRCLRAPA